MRLSDRQNCATIKMANIKKATRFKGYRRRKYPIFKRVYRKRFVKPEVKSAERLIGNSLDTTNAAGQFTACTVNYTSIPLVNRINQIQQGTQFFERVGRQIFAKYIQLDFVCNCGKRGTYQNWGTSFVVYLIEAKQLFDATTQPDTLTLGDLGLSAGFAWSSQLINQVDKPNFRTLRKYKFNIGTASPTYTFKDYIPLNRKCSYGSAGSDATCDYSYFLLVGADVDGDGSGALTTAPSYMCNTKFCYTDC